MSDPHGRYSHVSIDLNLDPSSIAQKLEATGCHEATQVHYYAYVAKDTDEELIKVNVPLLVNVGTRWT